MARQRTKITTIQVREDTREALKKLGRKGDTYDDIIQKLLSKR
jgi:predicted CopG family antitoxin